jgi:DNA-binding HxlR family transcriptional regulator
MVFMTISFPDNVNDANAHEVRAEFRDAIGMIAGKWKLEILWQLNQRTHRFGELRRAIPGITQHMLTSQLRALEEDGLITRQMYAEVPLRVEYEITDAARALKPIFIAIWNWSQEHPRLIDQPAPSPKRSQPIASKTKRSKKR